MKSLLLKWFTSQRIKSGVAFADQVVRLVADALSAVLASDGLNDQRRRQLNAILVGVVALRSFLAALSAILGVSETVHQSNIEELVRKSKELESIADSIQN